MVEWLYGDHQVTDEEPLLKMVRQVTEMIAEYAIENELTDLKGWKSPQLMSHIWKILNNKQPKKNPSRIRKNESSSRKNKKSNRFTK